MDVAGEPGRRGSARSSSIELIDTGSELLVLATELAPAVLKRAGVTEFKRLGEVAGCGARRRAACASVLRAYGARRCSAIT